MIAVILIAATLYAICGFLAYGFTFAYFQREYPEISDRYKSEDRRHALTTALFGPIGLLVVIIRKEYRHGFLL